MCPLPSYIIAKSEFFLFGICVFINWIVYNLPMNLKKMPLFHIFLPSFTTFLVTIILLMGTGPSLGNNRIGTDELLLFLDTSEVTGAQKKDNDLDNNQEWRLILNNKKNEIPAFERVLTGLLLTIILIFAIAWMAKGRRLIKPSKYVNLIDESVLVPGVKIIIFQVMGKILVISQTEKGLALLTEITDEEIVNLVRLEATGDNPPSSFKDALEMWLAGGDRGLRHRKDVSFLKKSINKLKNKGHEDD